MSYKSCASQEDLLSFVDAALAPEQLARVEQHLVRCPSCAQQVATLREVIASIAAPLVSREGQAFDPKLHSLAIMERLDATLAARTRPNKLPWGGVLAGLGTAAAAALLVFQLTATPELQEGSFAARGGSSESSLARDVGVQLYLKTDSLRPLGPGQRIRAHAALTAGVRNLAHEPAYLLLFAIDARDTVHWIAPQFLDPNTDQRAATIRPSVQEQLLPSSVVFDDLAHGTLRIVTLITAQPMHVSQIEALRGEELTGERLMARFPKAEIRQATLEVTP